MNWRHWLIFIAFGSTMNLIVTAIRFPSFEEAIFALSLCIVCVSLAIGFAPRM